MSEAAEGLKEKIFKGGAAMVVRQGLSLALSLVSAFCVIRLIGPHAYGGYTAAFGVYSYAIGLAQTGISVYLLRSDGELSKADYDVASTILLVTALVFAFILEALSGLLGGWVKNEQVAPLLGVLALALPIQAMTSTASAKLERALNFQSVIKIEMSGQVASTLVVVPLAYFKMGAWSLVAGVFVQQLIVCTAFIITSGYRPSWRWDPEIGRRILRYAFGYAAGDWMWQLRALANPLIVGHFLGSVAVGQISLAARIVGILSFFRDIAWRLSVVSFAKIQVNNAKLLDVTNQTMELQVLTVGPILLFFSLASGPFVDAVFGSRWQPVMMVFPFLAVGSLIASQFGGQSSALYVKQRNAEMFWVNVLNVAILAGVCWLLMRKCGIGGYGWAEIASSASWILLHFFFSRAVGRPDYRVAAVWCLGISIGMFWRILGPWALIAPLLCFCWPTSMRTLRRYWRLLHQNAGSLAAIRNLAR